MTLEMTGTQEIPLDSLLSKLKDNGVALLDNTSVSSSLNNNAPICAFRPVFGDIENEPKIIETFKNELPEATPQPAQATVAAAVPQYKNNQPGLT